MTNPLLRVSDEINILLQNDYLWNVINLTILQQNKNLIT